MIDLKKENDSENGMEFDELYSFTNSTSNKNKDEIVNVTLDREILRQLGYELLEIDNNIVGIKKDDQKITSLEIPALYDYNDNEYRITQVGDEVFKNCNILEEINLPTTVTKIGNKAFLGCKKLFSVHIPSSLKEIGDYAFLGCEHLTEIEIPNETKIGTNVFEDCKSLPYLIQKKFIIKSENVKEYEDNIYRQAKMDSVWGKIHTTTGYILIFISFIYCLLGNQKPAKMPWVDVFLAFFSGGCALIFIPLMLLLFIGKMRDLWPNKNEINNKTLERMGYKDKYSLTSIDIPKFYNISEKHTYTSRSNISSESQKYVEYTNYFYKITGIGKNAFKDCTNLTKVIIPDSVVKIDDQAFLNCTNLTEVVIPDSIKEIGNSVFSYCKNLKKLVIPDSVIKLGKFALYGLELNTLILPKRLEKEIDNAFLKNIENISYIALEDKYSEQNESPIFNVPQENKKIDRDVEKVKKEVVDNNYNWSNIETEKYINEQKQGMVMICALGSIFYIYVLFIILPVFFNLDKFLTYFITSIFALLCIKFSIDLYPTFDVLNDKLLKDLGLYRYKNTFRTFEIPPIYSSKNVRVSGRTFMITKIGNSAFKNCTNFKYIKIPKTIKKIGTEAFSGCTGLVSLNIPDSVQEIGKDAFLGVNNVIYNGTSFYSQSQC